jgi:hypothetical protein
MTKSKRFLFIFLCCAVLTIPFSSWSTPELIISADSKKIEKADKVKIELSSKRTEAKRSKLIEIDRKAFDSDEFDLSLFEDAKYKVKIKKSRQGDQSQFEAKTIIEGEIIGKPLSNVDFFIYDDCIVGRVYSGDRLFMLEDAGNGIVLLIEIDKSKMIPESPSLIPGDSH